MNLWEFQKEYLRNCVKSQSEVAVHMDIPDFATLSEKKKLELNTKTWFSVKLKGKARAKKWLLLVLWLKRDVGEGLNSFRQEEIEAEVHELIRESAVQAKKKKRKKQTNQSKYSTMTDNFLWKLKDYCNSRHLPSMVISKH